eukprot:3784077-Amphidinium_carterae.2
MRTASTTSSRSTIGISPSQVTVTTINHHRNSTGPKLLSQTCMHSPPFHRGCGPAPAMTLNCPGTCPPCHALTPP